MNTVMNNQQANTNTGLLNSNPNATATPNAPAANLPTTFQPGEIFMNIQAFEAAQRMIRPLSESDLVPATFQKRPANCLIALETAQRIGASPMMVMQNLYIVHGKPAWSSTFLIACINASRKFTPLRYRMTGENGTDTYGCVAWAIDRDGEKLESPEVTIGMAKAEGWYGKTGSKWKTMPELMLRYRAATFFARTYVPELTMGIQTQDEIIDITPVSAESVPVTSKFEKRKKEASKTADDSESEDAKTVTEPKQPEKSDLEKLAEVIDKKGVPVSAEEVKAFVENNGEFFSFAMVEPNLDAIAEAILGGK